MNVVTFFAPILALVAFLSSGRAVPLPQPEPKTIPAPPLGKCKISPVADLGLWDDVFVPPDRDFIVLRRGDALYSLAMDTSAKPRKIATAPAADNTQIVTGTAVDKRLWLFLNSRNALPCAVDALSGTVATFEIPGLKVPGSQAPGIQSYRIVPHLKAAILMVSGGDRATWPRDGNRPVYFWMDLTNGKVVRLPNGWDLDYFSADESVAAFGSTRAIEVKTGKIIDTAPNRRKESHIPFDWSDRQLARPLYEYREGKGAADYFAGLSVEGRILPVNLGIDDVRYLSMAKSDEAFAGFRLRRTGASRWGEPSPLWLVPFRDSKKTESIANDVIDFTMLGYGNTIYVTRESAGRRASAERQRNDEVFFYSRLERTSWNVLDGVERLPKLGEALAAADFIQDSLRVEIIEGFGAGKHEPSAMCLFEHQRGDMRAFALGSSGPAIKSERWRRVILVGRDGKRYLAPIFQDNKRPDQIWLHNSGKVLSGVYNWTEGKGERRRQVQLAQFTLERQ